MTLQTEILADLPTAYWPMSDTGSTQTDTIGSVVVTAVGTPAVNQDGLTGKGVAITTSSDYYELATGPSSLKWALDTDITIEFMHKKNSTPVTTGIIAHRTAAATNAQFGVFYVNGSIAWDVAGSSFRQLSTFNPPLNQWQHMVFRHRGSDGNREIWCNGRLVQSVISKPTSAFATAGTFQICNSVGTSATFENLSNVAIYNGKYLSDARLMAHWNSVANVNAQAFLSAAF